MKLIFFYCTIITKANTVKYLRKFERAPANFFFGVGNLHNTISCIFVSVGILKEPYLAMQDENDDITFTNFL